MTNQQVSRIIQLLTKAEKLAREAGEHTSDCQSFAYYQGRNSAFHVTILALQGDKIPLLFAANEL